MRDVLTRVMSCVFRFRFVQVWTCCEGQCFNLPYNLSIFNDNILLITEFELSTRHIYL